jgi:hypothetical protein
MTLDDVREAAAALEADGQPVWCRTILDNIGGSKRDVARYLRELRGGTAAPADAVPA